MTIATPPSISPVPHPPPIRSDRTTYSGRVDAFVTWLSGAVSEFANVAANVYANAQSALASALTAQGHATSAGDSAGLAVLYATTAKTVAEQVTALDPSWSPAVRLNPSTINTALVVPSGYNAASAGPLTIGEGVEVTLNDNSNWSIL